MIASMCVCVYQAVRKLGAPVGQAPPARNSPLAPPQPRQAGPPTGAEAGDEEDDADPEQGLGKPGPRQAGPLLPSCITLHLPRVPAPWRLHSGGCLRARGQLGLPGVRQDGGGRGRDVYGVVSWQPSWHVRGRHTAPASPGAEPAIARSSRARVVGGGIR